MEGKNQVFVPSFLHEPSFGATEALKRKVSLHAHPERPGPGVSLTHLLFLKACSTLCPRNFL